MRPFLFFAPDSPWALGANGALVRRSGMIARFAIFVKEKFEVLDTGREGLQRRRRSTWTAAVGRRRRDEGALLGRMLGVQAVSVTLGLAQAARESLADEADELIHVRKREPHSRRSVVGRGDDMGSVGAKQGGQDQTMMPFEGDEARRLARKSHTRAVPS